MGGYFIFLHRLYKTKKQTTAKRTMNKTSLLIHAREKEKHRFDSYGVIYEGRHFQSKINLTLKRLIVTP